MQLHLRQHQLFLGLVQYRLFQDIFDSYRKCKNVRRYPFEDLRPLVGFFLWNSWQWRISNGLSCEPTNECRLKELHHQAIKREYFHTAYWILEAGWDGWILEVDALHFIAAKISRLQWIQLYWKAFFVHWSNRYTFEAVSRNFSRLHFQVSTMTSYAGVRGRWRIDFVKQEY